MGEGMGYVTDFPILGRGREGHMAAHLVTCRWLVVVVEEPTFNRTYLQEVEPGFSRRH